MKSIVKDSKKAVKVDDKKLDPRVIERELWSVMSSVVDSVNHAVVAAASAKKLTINQQDLALLSVIVKSAAENAIAGATKIFMKKL